VRRGLFVTGTGTGVGKTVVCAALMRLWRGHSTQRLRYWKPIQTGIEGDDDTRTVRGLSGCGADAVLEEGIRLPRPLSPHLAARLAGRVVDLDQLTRIANRQSTSSRWIVEGAGGVLVPLNDTELMIDLIGLLRLPVLVVARSTLGTINYTLLTVEALRRRSIRIAGVVMVGPRNRENRLAIEHYGGVEVLAELPRLQPLTAASLRRWTSKEHVLLNRMRPWFQANS